MPRSSRHKSNRSQKLKDRSTEEESLRERSRISWDSEPEVEKGNDSQERDGIGPGNGELYGENGKKWKDRALEVSSASCRWNGEGMGSKREELDAGKIEKVTISSSDSKSKCNRRREDSGERKEEGRVRDEYSKRRRQSDGKNVDVKEGDEENSSSKDDERMTERNKGSESVKDRGREPERDRERDHRSKRGRERVLDVGIERDNVKESQREKLADIANRSFQIGSGGGRYLLTRDSENTEWRTQDELSNPPLGKAQENQIRDNRDDSLEKRWGNSKDSDSRRLYCRDDHGRTESYKDEKYRDGRYGEKEEHRDQSHRDARDHDIQAKLHSSTKSETKYHTNERKHSEICNESRCQDYSIGGSQYVDKLNMENKDMKQTKRSFGENEEFSDLKPKNANLPRACQEQQLLNNHKLVPYDDRDMPEHINASSEEQKIKHYRPRSPSSSTFPVIKDEYMHSSKKHAETAHSRSLSKGRHRCNSTSSGDLANISGVTERTFNSQSVESKAKMASIHIDDTSIVDTLQYETKSEVHALPVPSTEKSSVTDDLQCLKRKVSSSVSDIELMGQDKSHTKDGREITTSDNLPNHGQTRPSSSFNNRTDHFPGSSFPLPFVRHGADSPVLGSFEDNSRIHAGDRKSNSHYRRNDPNIGRVQGNAWKGVTNWPSPIANGFMPFPHGPSLTGFHPGVPQFPPSMFGVRPFMDMNHTGVPFHMHEAPERFSTHGAPFSWRNPIDNSCPPPYQGWEGSNAVFQDDSHMYGRADWEQNRHLIGNRSWEMNSEPMKEQKESLNNDYLASHSESDHSMKFPTYETHSGEDVCPLNSGDQSKQMKQLDNKATVYAGTPAKGDNETPAVKRQKTPADENNFNFCSTYLSKLDLSLDLAYPELYDKCIVMVGVEDPAITGSTCVTSCDFNVGMKGAVRNPAQARSSLFPQIKDDVLKKAISLYTKVNSSLKAKFLSSLLPSTEEEFLENLEEEKTMLVETHASAEDISLTNAHVPHDVEETVIDGCDVLGGILVDKPEKQSDTISSAVIFAEESSQGCDEDLISECLSRIHSPESTH